MHLNQLVSEQPNRYLLSTAEELERILALLEFMPLPQTLRRMSREWNAHSVNQKHADYLELNRRLEPLIEEALASHRTAVYAEVYNGGPPFLSREQLLARAQLEIKRDSVAPSLCLWLGDAVLSPGKNGEYLANTGYKVKAQNTEIEYLLAAQVWERGYAVIEATHNWLDVYNHEFTWLQLTKRLQSTYQHLHQPTLAQLWQIRERLRRVEFAQYFD